VKAVEKGGRLEKVWSRAEREFEESLIRHGLRALKMFIEHGIPKIVKSSPEIAFELARRGITRIDGNEGAVLKILDELAAKGVITGERLVYAYSNAPPTIRSVVGSAFTLLYMFRSKLPLDKMNVENAARFCEERLSEDPGNKALQQLCGIVLNYPNLTKVVIDFIVSELQSD